MEKKQSDLRFAEDVALITEDMKDMEHQLNAVNLKRLVPRYIKEKLNL